MTKRQRLQATLRGEETDRVPVALWRHWPGDDQSAEDLAAAHLAFQREYDFDFVKVSPASSFSVEDWGVETHYLGNTEGTREYVRRPVQRPADWAALRPLDPCQGALGRQLRCLEILQEALGHDVPFIQTVFSPLAQARHLAGDETLMAHLRQQPQALRAGLETIATSTVGFVQEVSRRGAAGIFYAVQGANYHRLCREEYAHLGAPHDRRVLEAADGLWLNVLHLHGPHVMFDLFTDYPVAAINWHDRETPPTLAGARLLTSRALIGGLRQIETLMRGTPDQVRAEAADALAQTGGRRFILGTGCVAFIASPTGNLRAARQAVER
ncbi:MAG: uroporphyrinogen decarboxylase [Chloroflexi bacterium]|nr:uroporphyrinogen decarboxylase [Chloroflexota bacterium]